MSPTSAPPVGVLLRDWRLRRRLSQLDLSIEAEVSSRHLSFVETGRSKPSRELLLHLAEQLDVPLRERNTLLLAAGFAPAYPEHDLDAALAHRHLALGDQVRLVGRRARGDRSVTHPVGALQAAASRPDRRRGARFAHRDRIPD